MKNKLRNLLITAGLIGAAAIPAKSEAQVNMAGSQTVNWQCVDPIRDYAINPIDWESIGYTITTNTGEVYTGHLAMNGAPIEPVVTNEERSFGSLKSMFSDSAIARKAITRAITQDATSITFELYNDKNHDNQPDNWDGTGYLNYTDTITLNGNTNELENIIMFEDRESELPDLDNGWFDIQGNGKIDLGIELLNVVRGAAPNTLGQYAGRLVLKTFAQQQHFHSSQNDTATEIARAQSIDAEFASNTTSHNFSGLPAPIVTVAYTGTSPRSGDDFDGGFYPNNTAGLTGQFGDFDITNRNYRINNGYDEITQKQALRKEKAGVFFMRGSGYGVTDRVTDDLRRIMRISQILGPQLNSQYIDMTKYSITE